MSRIRDIANILTAATNIATDTEVTSAVSTHATAANGHVGRGTTTNRPASPTLGDLYFDTTLNALIAYRTAGWEKVSQDPAPQIASISPTTAATTGTTVTITGSGFKSGLTVQFIGTNLTSYNSPVATFVDGTTATATTPQLSVAYEPYDVKVTNNDNQFGILEDALDSGGTPTWNTASGTIATINEQSSLSVSVSATDPDGTSIVYSSSNLPSWMSLNSSTGALTGTSPDISSDTTYSFNVTASDGVNTSSRSFNVISNYVLPTLQVNYLLVGGGGSGSQGQDNIFWGSGGGGGGVSDGTATVSVSTNYSVTVGAGGVAAVPDNNTSGSASLFTENYSAGGGTRGWRGGSGANSGVGGTGTTGNGGLGGPYNGQAGGAGTVAVLDGVRYGGGGGGPQGGANGGAGGGGQGGPYQTAGSPGGTNTGGGGGGGDVYGNRAGGNGGSGIVKLKYPDANTITIGAGLTGTTSSPSGGFKITTITAGTGNVSWA